MHRADGPRRYWNRYPGVMCDTEASIYCPLLEETGFIPTHKYAYGNEIREHAERVVRQWKLADSGVFRTRILDASWDDERKRWAVKMETDRGPGSQVSLIIYIRILDTCFRFWPRHSLTLG